MNVRRQLLIVACVLGLIGVADFAHRIYVPRDEALRSYAPPSLPALPPALDPAATEAKLETWLPALAATRPADAGPQQPADWDLKLVGTFEERRSRFAVIMANSGPGGKSERRRVAVGDVVYGRTVLAIGRGSLALMTPTGPAELRVFSPRRQ